MKYGTVELILTFKKEVNKISTGEIIRVILLVLILPVGTVGTILLLSLFKKEDDEE